MLKLERPITLEKGIELRQNLTDMFTPEDLDRIGIYVVENYDRDCESRKRWLEINKAGLDLAMQITEEKTSPWPNCANVAFPLVTIAALQFHARAYPALIPGKDVVTCKVSPFDATQEERQTASLVGRYMSHNVLEVDTAWEEQHDRLLLNLAIAGSAFIKTYFNGKLGHNVSELVLAQDLVMDYYATSVDSCRRKTQPFHMYRDELLAGIRMDKPKFRDVSNEPWFPHGGTPKDYGRNDATKAPAQRHETVPFFCLEQHVWLDLDGDGMEEPYVITVERESKSVLRIVTRWDREIDVTRNSLGQILDFNAVEYYSGFSFIPSPDGSVYAMGFGRLLGPLNETVSSAINQLLDAGSMSNGAGGFLGRGAKIKSGDYSFSPFEWKRLDTTGDDIAKSVFPLPVREPSAVLFNLINLLIEYTNRISGATEMLAGENPGQNTPAETSRAMVEQGMKIYGAIFKRVWRGMKEEFRKLYVLHAIHAPMRYAGLFKGDPRRICPSADPAVSSEAERLRKAALIAERAMAVPGYDPAAVEMNFLRAAGIEDPETFYKGVDPTKQPEDPRIVVAKLKLQQFQLQLQQQQQEFVASLMEERRMNSAEIIRIQAEVVKLMAEAEDARDNREIVRLQTALAMFKTRDEALRSRVDQLIKVMEIESEPERRGVDTGTVRRMVGASDNAASAPVPASQTAGSDGALGLG